MTTTDAALRLNGQPLPAKTAGAIEQALQFPLFEAILSRRARRFAVGASLPGGPTAWISQEPSLPLSPVEQDLLAAAGTGLSGLQLGDWSYRDEGGQPTGGNALAGFAGRTGASPCGIQAAQLFTTDDEQTSLIAVRRRLPDPGGDGNALACAVDGVRKYRIPVLDHRLEIPRQAPIMPTFNHWDVNVAGSTVFMPVVDLTRGLINNVLMYLDDPHNYYIVDSRTGEEPLRGFAWLDRERVVDLAEMERGAFTDLVGVESALMGENIYLALQALGLGGWLFSAPRAAAMLGGLGFRFEKDRPLGLDGIFEPLVAPYVSSPEAAVRVLFEEKWGDEGAYTSGNQPFAPRLSVDHQVPRTSERALDAATALYEYCVQTYGHFPATIPPVAPGVWVQAHHLELAFYDHYYGPGSYPESVRTHMATWHGSVKAN
ncbi:MAG: hypothetical protein ACYDCQ_01275 [Dehalococcoidia bacterium]